MAASSDPEGGALSPSGTLAFDNPVHASCVAFGGRGLLILGASGTGKSSLALQLIALGAALVADDRVMLRVHRDTIIASPPDPIAGLIEARGVGILNAPHTAGIPLRLVVTLDIKETDRLPPVRKCRIGPISVPLVHKSDSSHFPAALMLYLKHGRKE